MNAITRYFPGFVDVDDSERVNVQFETLDQLLQIPWVKHWKDVGQSGVEAFDRYSLSGNALMAELKNPREWWVIGFIDHPELLDLPKLDTSRR